MLTVQFHHICSPTLFQYEKMYSFVLFRGTSFSNSSLHSIWISSFFNETFRLNDYKSNTIYPEFDTVYLLYHPLPPIVLPQQFFSIASGSISMLQRCGVIILFSIFVILPQSFFLSLYLRKSYLYSLSEVRKHSADSSCCFTPASSCISIWNDSSSADTYDTGEFVSKPLSKSPRAKKWQHLVVFAKKRTPDFPKIRSRR